MKFYSVLDKGAFSDVSDLAADYKDGRAIGVVRIGKKNLFFRRMLKVYCIPFADIRRCYRRVVMVPARMCCGAGNLDIENIVIENGDGEIAQIEVPGRKAAVEMMKVLEERIPHAQFGCPPKASVSPALQEG